jgi:hypothetical protein
MGVDRGAQRVNAVLVLSFHLSRLSIQWRAGMAGPDDFPTLFQYALNTLYCPAMSTECERMFNSTKKLITPERNALAEDIIEACECLKA